ncbi:MAG: DUF2530 domain-containing protein [Streptosporangiaceae bacterium]
MAKPVKEVPPPLEGNDRMVAAGGSVVWAVALIVLLVWSLSGHLPAGRHWWLWTCVTGIGLGLFALVSIPRIKRSRALGPTGPADSGRPGGG